MYWKLFKNDIKHDLLQIFNIAFFIMLSVAFLSTAGQLALQLSTSIDRLFEEAKTPHLLQMHTGELDELRTQDFVNSHPEIEDYQILNFLNIDNSLLSFNEESLKDSVYDNGFSVQSPNFDYLLDLKGELIKAKEGEVYVPVFYLTSGLAKEGDRLNIGEHGLKIAGFVRDSQMNSSLSVSKRFIVHEKDYRKIEELGTLEYLIEFRLRDVSGSSLIETAYTQEKLEAEGPPFMTYALFKVVNAFSDGITIFTLVLIGILIIGICLLCIRFTLLAKLEEDYRELTVLKAIGLPLGDIKKIFLGKYIFIAATASILGFLLSFLIRIPLLENMKMFFGETRIGLRDVLAGLALGTSVFAVILFSMNKLADRLKRPLFEIEEEGSSPKSLSALPRPLHLALSDLFSRKKVYSTMATVFVLSVFILTLPMTMYSTISDKTFVNYLGLGNYDIRIDISGLKGREAEIDLLLEELSREEDIETFEVFRGSRIDYKAEAGSLEKMWIDFGDHERFPIKYIDGRAPVGEEEISLSKLKADDLSKKVGDILTLVVDGKEKQVLISGIFSDLTNGGKTAKANFKTEDAEVIRLIVPIVLKKGAPTDEFLRRYRDRHPFAKFSDTETYLEQIFGNTISMVEIITWVAFASCILLIFLIVILFIRMLYLKDLGQNALLKSIGFSDRELRRQYLIKTGTVLVLGMILGNLLSWSVGDRLGSAVLSMIGVHGVEFIRNPLFSYLFVPFVLLFSSLIAVRFGIGGLNRIDIAQSLKEDVS
ncbi:MAG: ABC transporter permease [Filifactor alocis]|nr:ABC transporter permease [Filifactor alocis]